MRGWKICKINKRAGGNKRGQGAKVVKSLNKNYKEGRILQEINKRGEGKLCEEGGKI